jgi:hypothetical protein
MSKTACNVTRSQFRATAKPIALTIDGLPMGAMVKEFSTGSLGWYANGKTTIKLGDKSVDVQVGLNLTIIGSKELPLS